MSLILRCPTCDTEIDVRRRHRGTDVRCPRRLCEGTVAVPVEFESRDRIRGLVKDRARADWMTFASLSACIFWLPLIPAFVWFVISRRIGAARTENRTVALELYTARTVAIVALMCQLLWYALWQAKLRYDFGAGVFMSW